MSTPDKAGIASRALGSLVFAIGLLAGLPGTAGAQSFGGGGVIDFCNTDPATGKLYYDNAWDPTTGVDNTLLTGSNLPIYSYPQSFGSFTDLGMTGWFTGTPLSRRNHTNMINVFTNMHSTTNPGGTNPWADSPTKPATCALNFYGDSGKTSDNKASMWITILAAPQQGKSLAWLDSNGLVPKFPCWGITATVWYDNAASTNPPDIYGAGGWNNSKGVGIVTNFDPQTNKGLFLAMYDAGNTESLALVQFDASVDYPNNIVNPTVIASKALAVSSISSAGDGGSTVNSKAYVMTLDVCTDSTANHIDAYASMAPAERNGVPLGTCPSDNAPDQQCLVYHGNLPAGIVGSGAVGLATLAPTSGAGVVDTYVSKFTFVPRQLAPD